MVILVAGFGVPTASLKPLARALGAHGHRVRIAPTGLNVDCGEATATRLERLVAEAGRPVTIVGHSRGGQLARVVAVRRPDLVTHLVTVGTPWSIGPPDRPGVAAVTKVVRRARRAGLPILGSIDCADGDCCTRFRADLDTVPAVPWTAVWSRRDRVAGDDATPPAGATAVEVDASHLGLVLSPAGRQAILDLLGAPG